jgi:hypothetical protein
MHIKGRKTKQKPLGRRRFNLTTVMKVMDDEDEKKGQTTGGQELYVADIAF